MQCTNPRQTTSKRKKKKTNKFAHLYRTLDNVAAVALVTRNTRADRDIVAIQVTGDIIVDLHWGTISFENGTKGVKESSLTATALG